MSRVTLEKLTEGAFSDYERLTNCDPHRGCFCAFWHQKWPGMAEWKARQEQAPELNRQTVLDRVRSGFHVGVLAYQDGKLLAWISVAPLIEFYWTQRRVIQLGESARTTAGITCITVAREFRGKGYQTTLLKELLAYTKSMGWTSIEGYPFDESAVKKQGDQVSWPGFTNGFVEAGFERVGPHWLSQSDYERSIYRVAVS